MLFLSHGTIWKPRFLREPPPPPPPPPPLSTNPPISEKFFHDSPLYPNFKNENPPLGGGNYDFNNYSVDIYLFEVAIKTSV